MGDLTQHLFLSVQTITLAISVYALIYMFRRLKGNRWYFLHVLPLIVYSAHVAIYYLALLIQHKVDAETSIIVMAWSVAIRLHGAIMVLTMARTVVACLRNC